MTTLTEEQIKNIWKEVIEDFQEGDVQPGEKTKKDIVAEHNLTPNQAETLLTNLMKREKVTRRLVMIRGHSAYVYKVVTDGT